MIRDDDLAWARTAAHSPGITPSGTLARLVLHVHEQDRPRTSDLLAGPMGEDTFPTPEPADVPVVDLPLSPPPEAVAWAQMVVRDAEENGYGPSPLAAFSEQEVISARFILQAAGKDTDE